MNRFDGEAERAKSTGPASRKSLHFRIATRYQALLFRGEERRSEAG